MNKLTFEIDSHQKLSGSHTDFLFPIPMANLEQADTSGLQVVLLSANIPKTFYTLPASRSSFTVIETGGGGTTIVTLTPGFYGASTFRTAVLTALNALGSGKTYTITFDSITAKYTFTFTGGGTSSIVMPTANGSGIHELFGLEANSTTALPFTSPNVVNFGAKSTVQIHSDLVGGYGNDILCAINASSNINMSSIVYQCPQTDAYAKKLKSKSINVARFYVTDEDGNPIDTNGSNCAFSIMIYAPLDTLIESYIKAKILEMNTDDPEEVEREPQVDTLESKFPA